MFFPAVGFLFGSFVFALLGLFVIGDKGPFRLSVVNLAIFVGGCHLGAVLLSLLTQLVGVRELELPVAFVLLSGSVFLGGRGLLALLGKRRLPE